MRLVDADKIIERLKCKNAIGEIGKVTIEECIAEIEYADTIKPERKRGRWIISRERLYDVCSCCGEDGHKTFNFCPNCGCDMRGSE